MPPKPPEMTMSVWRNIRLHWPDVYKRQRLRDCIAKAKANNMPNDNIKRTLDKYSGANGQVDYEANNYEGYGVGGVAVVCLLYTSRFPTMTYVFSHG